MNFEKRAKRRGSARDTRNTKRVVALGRGHALIGQPQPYACRQAARKPSTKTASKQENTHGQLNPGGTRLG